MVSINNSGLLPPGSNVSRIDLTGNSNYLKIDGDSISAYLPFYGERQLGGGYSNRTVGIEIDGEYRDLKVTKGKKDSKEIRFSAKDKNSTNENYNVYIQVFSNKTSNITINSSHRTRIRYSGKMTPLEKEEKSFN